MRPLYKVTGERSTVALFLDNTRQTESKLFCCTACGRVVLHYFDELRVIVGGEGPLKPDSKPMVRVQCRNNQCKTVYDIYLGATNGSG